MVDPVNDATPGAREKWLHATLASIGDAVITADPHGRITFLNEAAATLTGFTVEQAVGADLTSVFRIVDEQTRSAVEDPRKRTLRAFGAANGVHLIDQRGIEHPIAANATPIQNGSGEAMGIVIVFRDVTNRAAEDRSLHQTEERFRLLVESVRDYAIFMLDPNGIVASWNVGAERIKGYRAHEIIGRHFEVFYPKERIDEGFPRQELVVAGREGRFEDEGWRLRKNGTRFWASVVITAIRDDAGVLRGFAKVTRDLTQRRQLELARTQSEAFVELDRKKDQFLAMLSHELRNPLAPIVSAMQILRREKEADPKRERALVLIDRQVGNMTRLIEDLLEVSRITTGRIRLKNERVDARGIVEHAIETVRASIAENQQEVVLTMPDVPVWLRADETRIEQVVVNLLTNASKYSDKRDRIGIDLRCEGDRAVLRVKDNGVGIAPDLLPQIFDLFTQADRSLDRAKGGLGIGLTIVRKVVEMHGGTVAAHSAGAGAGSEFLVRLPLAQDETPPDAAVLVPGAVEKRSIRILVVDDNQDAAEAETLILRHFGHEVEVAFSSKSALEQASRFRPEVVLLDIGLPEIDGLEVARRLRAAAETKDSRLIAISGYGQPSDRVRSRDAGFDAHLVKPVDPKELLESIDRLTR